jgi:hypothetical protein
MRTQLDARTNQQRMHAIAIPITTIERLVIEMQKDG